MEEEQGASPQEVNSDSVENESTDKGKNDAKAHEPSQQKSLDESDHSQESHHQEVKGDQNAISMYGDASVHIHPPPISSVLPEWVWMVPYRRNTFFTGREELLRELHEHFMRDRAMVLTQGQAINGLGGIGKTQISVEYAYRHQEEYHVVLWASAANQETLRAAYVTMADRLQLAERHAQEQDKVVAAVLHWLATHEGWLLIVDNADEVDMIWPMLPTGDKGHLLLTTRGQAVGGMESFVVEPMTLVEGTLLLLRRARVLKAGMELEQIAQTERHAAEQIVIEVDGPPLALDQAGAYIEEAACSIEEYLAAYRLRRSTFLATRGRPASDHPAPVATTWALSFERVEQQSPAAADLLRVCAFLAPDAIPEELIITGSKYFGLHLQQVGTESLLLQEMTKVLRSYSLVHRDPKGKALSVHRLVQTVLQDNQEEDKRHQWKKQVMLAVNLAFPQVEHSAWSQCERLLPHALLAIQYIETEQIIGEEAGRLLHVTATYLQSRARYTEAETLYLRALHIRKQALGMEHLAVASSCNNLANLYFERGRYAEAESLCKNALHIREQQLGLEHPLIASSLNNLANLYIGQGKYTEAEPLCKRALHIWEQELGPEHPDVAHALSNLSDLYHEQGRYTEAEPLCKRALHIWEQQYGLKHPEVASSLHRLANLYAEQGRYTEAEPLCRRALHIWEQELEHPNAAHALNSLAEIYREQDKYTEAAQFYQSALRIWEQSGPEFLLVASPLYGLALLCLKQRKYAEAEPLFQRALRILEQQLGPEHPHVASILSNMANLYSEQSKYIEAELLFQRALRILEQQLGPEHPKTAESIHDLAVFQERQQNYQGALLLYQRAFAIREQTLGREHPKTRVTYLRLTALRQSIEDD